MDLSSFLGGAQSTLQVDWATATSMAIVALIALASLRLLGMAVRGVSRGLLQREKEPARELAQKAKTLAQVAETTGRIVIFTISVLSLLSLAGRDITPLLASAGIAGIAVGFGAQNMIKDWLGGFFILLENQYSVDDVIKVGDHTGTVEKLDLRRTVLRSAEGSVIVIPNGEVRVVANLTKGWSRAVVDVNIPYEADLDRVMEALRRVGVELAADEAMARLILEPPEVLGVEALAQNQVTIRITVKTWPARQWAVARALRARVKKMFDLEGLLIPTPPQATVSAPVPAVPSEGRVSPLVGQRERSE